MKLIAYCRPGFEQETVQDLHRTFAAAGITGTGLTADNTGYVVYDAPALAPQWRPDRAFWQSLIFIRQLLVTTGDAVKFMDQDRVSPIIQALYQSSFSAAQDKLYGALYLEGPDTNDGKSLNSFFKKFQIPLQNALKREGWKQVFAKGNRAPRLHIFFPHYDEAWVGFTFLNRSSPWSMGIPRLKFPEDAPSRSTLKLEEALLTLIDADQFKERIKEGMRAVDLGASPGGWTYQLVRRGLFVSAVDNGPMESKLMNSGLVEHLKEDGFKYRPKKPVDIMVCDMVESPVKVAQLAADWLRDGKTRQIVANLKLPMKQRYPVLQECLGIIRSSLGIEGELACKQLYHDREEVTVYAYRAPNPGQSN